MTLTSPAAEITRDHYGRPYILPKGHTKHVPYTRCTTFVSAFEDTFNLEAWKMRQAAIGLSLRPDLQLAVVAARDDKKRLNTICQEALDAAASSAAATKGIALHSLTEQVDRGQEVHNLPAETVADLAAYADATKDLKAVHIEQMTVHDPFKVAGTPDRVVSYKGKRYISDLKTGDITWGAGKIAAQLAMYARSELYDVATGERSIHGADLERGLVIHLPAGTGTASVVWVDLLEGWKTVITCRDVRERRKVKAAQLYEPFTAPVASAPSLEDRIKACVDGDAVRALWSANETSWTDALTTISRDHIASLGSGNTAA